MLNLKKLLPFLLLLLPMLAQAKEIDLRTATKASTAIALVRVQDPRSTTVDIPVDGPHNTTRMFQRYRRNYQMVEMIKGKLPQELAIDEPRWQIKLAEFRKCKGSTVCAHVPTPSYAGTLAKEPKPTDLVLIFVVKNKQGEWELTAEQSIDARERLPQVRKLLASAK